VPSVAFQLARILQTPVGSWRGWIALTLGLSLALTGPMAADAGEHDRQFVSSDGVRLHYREAGKGQTLVFVPGWSMPADIWDAQIDYFARQGFRAVAFDPRGQGDSEIARAGYDADRRARDIRELIDHLGEERVVLVGWSLGVLDALAYAQNHGSHRLSALVLVDNSIGEDPPPRSDPTFLRRLRSEREKTVERFVRHMFRTPQTEGYLRRITDQALRLPLEHSVALLSYSQPRTFWRKAVYATPVPVLYAITPHFREQAANLMRKRPNTRIEVFENAGHALFVDEPDRFNRLLADFLTTSVSLKAAR